MNIASIILSIVALLCFAWGGYSAYDNHQKLQLLRGMADDRLQKTDVKQADKDKEVEVYNALVAEREEVEENTAEKNTALEEVTQEIEDQQKENASIEKEVERQEELIEEVEAQVSEIGSIETLIPELNKKKDQLRALQRDLASSEQNIAVVEQRIVDYNQRIEDLSALSRAQAAGEIVGGLTTSVQSAFPQDGWVVIRGGFNQGVVSGAHFSIQRAGEQVALGVVSSVHANQAVLVLDSATITGAVAVGDSAVYVQR